MATPVKMPELGESISEGTITRWLKQEGDRVEADEPLFEVSTDKVDTEVPSPVAGVLKSIKVQADETVQVGAELAEIEQDGEGAGETAGGETTSVTMPELGESISEGTITRWLKQEGDRVEADEPLFEVSTDKVDTEVPAPVGGVLESIKAQQDETVQVGAELAVIATGASRKQAARKPAEKAATPEPAEEQADRKPAEEPQAAPAEERPSGGKAAPAPAKAGGDGKAAGADGQAAVVSPLVRRLAREHGIDLAEVAGSGAGGGG